VEKNEGSNEPFAKIKGVAWSMGSKSIQFFEETTSQKFTSGIQVLAKVKVEFHKAHGFSLVVNEIDPSFTLGNLERQRLETLQRLVNENPDAVQKIGEEFFTKNKSLQVPDAIQNIAVIGSPNSEGYVDFTHTLHNNLFDYTFRIDSYQSSVQGAFAENELINKLIYIFESGIKYDCVVIIRGGGARTDFLVFDSYRLARTVARFPIPIITGIGHHKDVSIVDMMAHTSTKTPTKAAEFIISHNRAFEEQVMNMQKTIVIKSQQLLALTSQKINRANVTIVNNTRNLLAEYKESVSKLKQISVNKTQSIIYRKQNDLGALLTQLSSRPKIVIANKGAELKNSLTTIKIFTGIYFKSQIQNISQTKSLIKMMSPENILKKGFAIVSVRGKITTSAQDIEIGSELTVTMDKYKLETRVTKKTKTNEKNTDL